MKTSTTKISTYVKRIKQSKLTPKQHIKLHYKLGKLMEQGEHVSLSTKTKRGARRTYQYYRKHKQELQTIPFTARDLSQLNEVQFQLLMGHLEFSRGNVLD